VIATSFALVCFIASIVVGVLSDSPTSQVILRAMWVMLVGWCVGMVIGTFAQRIVEEHIESYKKARPIPDLVQDGFVAKAQEEDQSEHREEGKKVDE
jgi:hypothetical protein